MTQEELTEYYLRTIMGIPRYNYHPVKQRSYACECKRCNLTHYTSYKRANCELCGNSDPEVFTCTELGE